MKAEHYFLELNRSILNISSKADLILFGGKIKQSDWNKTMEDVVTCHCFYVSMFNAKPPFLTEFLDKDNVVDKIKQKEKARYAAFFTPTYIAEYIVIQTIGPLIEQIIIDKRVKDKVKKICGLKICDPALGGAIFLICAQNFIMEELIKIDQEKYSIKDMSEMSLKTLYGVDINPEAIEFSKMALNLNCAKWKIVDQLDEYVAFAEKNLS